MDFKAVCVLNLIDLALVVDANQEYFNLLRTVERLFSLLVYKYRILLKLDFKIYNLHRIYIYIKT